MTPFFVGGGPGVPDDASDTLYALLHVLAAFLLMQSAASTFYFKHCTLNHFDSQLTACPDGDASLSGVDVRACRFWIDTL